MSHDTQIIQFRAGATFGLSGFVKTGLTGALSGYAQLFNLEAQVAVLEVDVQPVSEPPTAPYADYTHTVVISYEGDTSGWPVVDLRANLLIVDGAGVKVPTPAYVVKVLPQLSRVVA